MAFVCASKKRLYDQNLDRNSRLCHRDDDFRLFARRSRDGDRLFELTVLETLPVLDFLPSCRRQFSSLRPPLLASLRREPADWSDISRRIFEHHALWRRMAECDSLARAEGWEERSLYRAETGRSAREQYLVGRLEKRVG